MSEVIKSKTKSKTDRFGNQISVTKQKLDNGRFIKSKTITNPKGASATKVKSANTGTPRLDAMLNGWDAGKKDYKAVKYGARTLSNGGKLKSAGKKFKCGGKMKKKC